MLNEPEELDIPEERQAPRRRANDLDGATWTRYSISVWSDIRKTPDEVALHHPAMFPIALASRLIACFTTANDKTVLDPFAGVGTTPIAAELAGKRGVGIELEPKFAKIARERPTAVELWAPAGKGKREIFTDDARHLGKYVRDGEADLVVTSPPYWDILLQRRTADSKAIRHYGDEEADLGKIADYKEFIEALGRVFDLVFRALRPGAYCCVVVMDLRKQNHFYPYHADLAARLQQSGFIFDDMVIWDRRLEYNNLRPLGYPYVFRVNKTHEFILVFQKPR